MKIEVKSATRVDLAGGTLDCWPLYLLFGGATTLNLPISIFTHAKLESCAGVRVTSDDLEVDIEVPSLKEFLSLRDPRLQIYQIFLRHYQPKEGFHLSTRSESPIGGGLGGSSSLLMSCLKAFSQWLGFTALPHEMIRLASNI